LRKEWDERLWLLIVINTAISASSTLVTLIDLVVAVKAW